jgi:uncharacterized integral membrane protein
MTKYLKIFILIVIVLLLISFGLKNSEPVPLNYYFDLSLARIPLYAVIYLSIILGLLIGLSVGFTRRLRLRRTVKNLESENKAVRTKRIEETRKAETS